MNRAYNERLDPFRGNGDEMSEGTTDPQGPQEGQIRRVLLVDDNDRYAESLQRDLEERGAVVVRVSSAREGLDALENSAQPFDAVVSDISMEGQLAGLKVLRRAKKMGSVRLLACATTGLDTRIGFYFNYLVLGLLYRCDYLIPKRPIKQRGHVQWLRVFHSRHGTKNDT